MARPLRIEFPGALYHITARGDRQEDIFVADADRFAFLGILEQVVERYNWLVHTYCLMDNHYHLLIETPDGNLSKGMRQLNGVYTQTSNRINNRVGHVFQGRYKAILVQKETYLLELSRYIVLNPVRARMVRFAKAWRWSSYRYTAGYQLPPEWLSIEWLLTAFGRKLPQAQKSYRLFVTEGSNQSSPWKQLRSQVFLGTEEFVNGLQGNIDSDKDLTEIPKTQRRKKAKSLEHYAKHALSRNEAIVSAYSSGGYSMKDIGKYFELHYSWVSRLIKANNKT